MKGYLAIQCTAADGNTGDFLYAKEEGKKPSECKQLTPVFTGLLELYTFLHDEGWRACTGHDYDGLLTPYEKDD
jgi:hypothetical protein